VICILSARRIRPGSYEAFREAWGPGDAPPPGAERWNPIYVCRDVKDPDVVLTFGMFDGSLEELREAQGQHGRDEQLAAVHPYMDYMLFDGAFEVMEELRAEGQPAAEADGSAPAAGTTGAG
jgi:hypothetical protein